MFDRLLSAGIKKLHRDTFHASLGAGRFALALLWIKTLTGNTVEEILFSQFDEEITDDEIQIIKNVVSKF